ncbi:hypothetical protein ABID59_004725 [Bradyrhizobium sp. S3.3.6]
MSVNVASMPRWCSILPIASAIGQILIFGAMMMDEAMLQR